VDGSRAVIESAPHDAYYETPDACHRIVGELLAGRAG
jgi:hypothetical protein